jgi:hypothetical protein
LLFLKSIGFDCHMMSILMFDLHNAATSALVWKWRWCMWEYKWLKCRAVILLGGPLVCGCVSLCPQGDVCWQSKCHN